MKMSIRHVAVQLAFGLLIVATAFGDTQERYAVLVGVGQYPYLDESLQLKGPPNDVRLVREHLLHVENFKEDNISWLADDSPTPPQRDNIIDALAGVDSKVGEGDFVLLHFSGHGSRQPAHSGDSEELDGYDEIFLPADVRGWDDQIGSVENAITDNELGAFISSYRSKGADVWLISDSCHSGTMTKGAGDHTVRTRLVRAEALGIPEPQRPGAVDGPSSSHPLADDYEETSAERGMLIAFSGAHTTQEAPEMNLPQRDEQSEPRGLLTHAIITALSRFPGVSYRQLAQLVTDQYASIPWFRSTPQFYGSHMDRVVFDGSSERASLFRAEVDDRRTGLKVDAGTIRGFDVGAIVAIHADAGDTDESLIGTGTVAKAAITEAAVTDIEWDERDEDAEVEGCQGRRCVPTNRRIPVYVRLVAPAYSRDVLISMIATTHDQDNQRLKEIMAALEPRVKRVEFADDEPDADYFAAFFDDRFWLLRPSQTLPCSVQRFTDTKQHRECEATRQPQQILWSRAEDAHILVSKAAKVSQLNRLQGVVSSPGTVSIGVQVRRANDEVPVSLTDNPGPLNPGDEIYYSVRPNGADSWDVFLFYVDSQLGITALQAPGHSVRVLPNEQIDTRLLGEITDETVGIESLVIIADPAGEKSGQEADYYFLTQAPHELTHMKGSGSYASPLEQMLGEIWTDSKDVNTKSLGKAKMNPQIGVFTWTVEHSGE